MAYIYIYIERERERERERVMLYIVNWFTRELVGKTHGSGIEQPITFCRNAFMICFVAIFSISLI